MHRHLILCFKLPLARKDGGYSRLSGQNQVCIFFILENNLDLFVNKMHDFNMAPVANFASHIVIRYIDHDASLRVAHNLIVSFIMLLVGNLTHAVLFCCFYVQFECQTKILQNLGH